MKRSSARSIFFAGLMAFVALAAWRIGVRGQATPAKPFSITIDYPADGSAAIRAHCAGERMRVGESDPRCISPNNKPPALTPEQAAAHTWTPDGAVWSAIKKRSVGRSSTATCRSCRRRPKKA